MSELLFHCNSMRRMLTHCQNTSMIAQVPKLATCTGHAMAVSREAHAPAAAQRAAVIRTGMHHSCVPNAGFRCTALKGECFLLPSRHLRISPLHGQLHLYSSTSRSESRRADLRSCGRQN